MNPLSTIPVSLFLEPQKGVLSTLLLIELPTQPHLWAGA